MSINIDNPKQPGNGKVFVGLLLLVLGIGFLFQQLNFYFIPNWLFSWPSWLIIWGLYVGARHNFQNSSWFIMVAVGTVFLLDRALPGYNLHNVIWPVGIIAVGIWLITRRNHHWENTEWGKKWEDKWNKGKYKNGNPFEPVITPVTPVDAPAGDAANAPASSTAIPPTGSRNYAGPTGDDYLDAVSIFGGTNKTIFSKSFKGGDIVNIFGGAELDFTQADISGRVIIDITQVFGGTKIIVPSNWQVISDMAAIFAGIDDKRIKNGAALNSDKILVLKGVSIFAGIDIRSY